MTEQNSPRVELKMLVQVGIVVRDLDRTMNALSTLFGIGPFRQTTWPLDRPDMQGFYYGKPAQFKFRMAFVQVGPVEMELIQPLEGDNIYFDFLREHGEGIHHLRFDVDNVDQFMHGVQPMGVDVIQSGTGLRPGSTWAYLNTEQRVGFILEVLNRAPGYDGKTPVPEPPPSARSG